MTLHAMAFVVEGTEADKQSCLDEVRSVVERLCRDVRRSGRYVLANPLSAEYAHQACSRILGACQTIPPGYRRCFVVLPMGSDGSDARAQSDCVFTRVIRPACERLKYVTVHPGQQDGEDVWGDISNSLVAADHVIAYLGSAPWNPNVMLEVGYRLATAKPLMVLAPGGDLPFDLKNHRTIILPAVPSSLTELEAEEKVAELMELTTKRVARDRGWAGLHPTGASSRTGTP